MKRVKCRGIRLDDRDGFVYGEFSIYFDEIDDTHGKFDVSFGLNISNQLILFRGLALSENILHVVKSKKDSYDIINSIIEKGKYYALLNYKDVTSEVPGGYITRHQDQIKQEVVFTPNVIRTFKRMRENMEDVSKS